MLPAITMSLDVDEIERRGHALFDALDDEMAVALERSAEIVAEEARQHHLFENQTGDLQDSIQVIQPVGSFLAGSLRSGVVANMPYASYVDENPRFQFLEPALEHKRDELDAEMQAGADRAARRAGW